HRQSAWVGDPQKSKDRSLVSLVSSYRRRRLGNRVGAAAGCDLLILILKSKIKRSQPSAAPTGNGVFVTRCLRIFYYCSSTVTRVSARVLFE
ncbi:hypothetical protein, partial [Pseudomonas sp. RIT288]|uniref:hypothetical protein n=1 Tax=Pseudomonas sp. RIT288 TaxID=1470589 RepID=UPI001F21D1BB